MGPEWGDAFWKTNAYAPYPVWIWLNGHEWAKRQLVKGGIGYTALDNGFRSCEDPALLQQLCDRLGPGAVTALFWRCFHRLPSPFTAADLRAVYVYEVAFRQFRSLTPGCSPGPPPGGPSSRALSATTWTSAGPTRYPWSSTARCAPPGHAHAGTGSAPRSSPTESTPNRQLLQVHPAQAVLQGAPGIAHRDGDLRHPGLRHRAVPDLRELERPRVPFGEHANQRLCAAEAADATPAPDVATLNQLTRPSVNSGGQHAPALRFGETPG